MKILILLNSLKMNAGYVKDIDNEKDKNLTNSSFEGKRCETSSL